MLNILRFLFSSPTKACFLPHQSPLAFCCQEKSLQAGCSKGERKGKEARGGGRFLLLSPFLAVREIKVSWKWIVWRAGTQKQRERGPPRAKGGGKFEFAPSSSRSSRC